MNAKTIITTLCLYSSIALSGPATKIFPGVFGICNCSRPIITGDIRLTIREDSTFEYIDNSDPAKKIHLEGKWTASRSHITLLAPFNNKSFHRRWKFSKDGMCIRSRYKMNFRRICKSSC